MALTATIDATGFHAPSFAEVLSTLTSQYFGIYGSDAYIAADSQDGQQIAAYASAIYDLNQALGAAYYGYSPTYAQGVGLSNQVKINGLRRLSPSNSTAILTVIGQTGRQIINGVAVDGNQNKWSLPATVTFPLSGTIDVTATCQTVGAIPAAANSINTIFTPTVGWQSVNNAAAAVLGAPVESDAALRLRQAQSTSQPGQAIVTAIEAAITNTAGVVRAKVYENPTGSTDANGLPNNSIAAVVDGGDVMAVAQSIADRKPPGTQTDGTTTETVNDPKGQPIVINFYPLTHVTISVAITIKALPGYVSTTGVNIQTALSAFISALAIGEFSYAGRLYAPANLSGDAATTATGLTQAQLDAQAQQFNVLNITQSRTSNPVDTTVTGGPYTTGAVAASVADTSDLYVGARIRFILDNAANFDIVITSIGGSSVGFAGQPVPSSRNIPTGSNVYLLADIKMAFNEAAQAAISDITLTVVT